MEIQLSFHRLCHVPCRIDQERIILAAAGSTIQTLSLDDGKLLSRWPALHNEDPSDDGEQDHDDGARPNKRRKLEEGNQSVNLSRQASAGSDASIEIVSEGKLRQKGERRKPKIPTTTQPNISHLIATKDGKHVVAVTAEDKAVRVFDVKANGKLKLQTSRSLPKRLCAVCLTSDDRTILAADKFGDVYSLPLLPTEEYTPRTSSKAPEEFFKPSATELTVHTKGNLQALRQQQLRKSLAAKKEGPDFELKLLLGHVSLLTDLAVAERTIQGKSRSFILTADRDEHIRISRGIPQAHIIEGFCLGHREFVSKLCVVPWSPQLLLAGNGEPSLRVFDWASGTQLSQFEFLKVVHADIQNAISGPERTLEQLAVSGIWTANFEQSDSKLLLVALEALPLLFTFHITHEAELEHLSTLHLDGNVLDVAVAQDSSTIIISLDHVHKAGSFKTYNADSDSHGPSILSFKLNMQQLNLSTSASDSTTGHSSTSLTWEQLPWSAVPETIMYTNPPGKIAEAAEVSRGKTDEKTYTPVGELFYGLENLRKWRVKAGEDNDEVADGGVGELEGAPEI